MSLPSNVEAYKKTPIFNEDCIPAALLKSHQTMKDVWGKIVVLEGKLKYTIETQPPEEIELSEVICGIVEPQVLHSVMALGKVKFYVEFYKEL